jgi:hypothetical protein
MHGVVQSQRAGRVSASDVEPRFGSVPQIDRSIGGTYRHRADVVSVDVGELD